MPANLLRRVSLALATVSLVSLPQASEAYDHAQYFCRWVDNGSMQGVAYGAIQPGDNANIEPFEVAATISGPELERSNPSGDPVVFQRNFPGSGPTPLVDELTALRCAVGDTQSGTISIRFFRRRFVRVPLELGTCQLLFRCDESASIVPR